jgi:two-component system, chemotaxis family, response regulator Rcp1
MTTMIHHVADARSTASSRGRCPEAGRPIHILLVEDNPADTRLTIETLRDDKILNNLSVVTDGELALQFLRRDPPYPQATRPDLLLVDLTLPRRDGPELVTAMRSDPELRSIPVALLTASAVEQELLSASGVRADFYVRKPVDLQQFMRIVGQIGEFGITVVTTSGDSTPTSYA